MPSIASYSIHTAFERPDLFEQLSDAAHPLNKAWPEYMDHDPIFQKYIPLLSRYDELARYQFMVQDRGIIVAMGRSVPFHWPQLANSACSGAPDSAVLETLPDKGYDAVLESAVEQCVFRHSHKATSGAQNTSSANALSTISITVAPEKRGEGLPAMLLAAMKKAAIADKLRALLVPLRPTLKHRYPHVDMSDYMHWTQDKPAQPGLDSSPLSDLPFDPWLRTHIRLGAKVIRPAKQSMLIGGTRQEWESWTGIDINRHLQDLELSSPQTDASSLEAFYQVPFPGGLVPLRVCQHRDWCTYVEPNIWLHHPLQ